LTASTVMVGVYNACLFWFLMGLAVGRQEETEKGTVPFGDSPFFNWMFSNKHPFRWVFFITGAGGIIAQVILMRELLVGFYGNELTIGIILANWVILEALGVIAGGWIIKRAKNKLNIFTLFTVIFSILLIVLIFLARTFKPILGLPQGEGVGILNILLISGLALFPVAFCHGVLFNCGTSIFSSLGWAYAWETAGTIAGGLIITYIFLPHVGSFSAASILAVLSIGSCFLIRKYLNKGMVYFCATSGFLIFVLFLLGGANKLESISIAKEWNKENVISYRNSLYGNIAITKKSGQTTLFYNGQPVIVAPYPDITFIEEFGNLPLLFHPYPKNVLIIGSGVGGLIKETLKHSDIKVDYTEIDPAIIQSVKDYFDKSARGELANARVHTINNDGRFFLRNTRNHYDVIIIGVSRVSDLTENRFFTFEFFLLAKQKLNQGGILAFWLPGSLSYLSHDLKDLNACVLNSLIQAYPFVRVIPGDYNIFLASSSKDILAVTPVMIEERISARHIFTQSLIPSYLLYRLDPGKVIWFGQALSGATKSMNLDLKPLAVFKSLVLWNKQFSPIFANFLDFLEKINLSHILTTILFLTAAIAFV
ncbi:MAG: hypothetical protein NT033_04885, partial [Candidatus Omnitrophica bacterium]|nr:hypothetical protein [Candidatus Omnitrophota bacterium]